MCFSCDRPVFPEQLPLTGAWPGAASPAHLPNQGPRPRRGTVSSAVTHFIGKNSAEVLAREIPVADDITG